MLDGSIVEPGTHNPHFPFQAAGAVVLPLRTTMDVAARGILLIKTYQMLHSKKYSRQRSTTWR